MSSPTRANPQTASKPTSSRLPPPSLFQGPPSRNTSNISLVTPGAPPPGRAPIPNAPSKTTPGVPQPPLNRSISARARQSQIQNESDRADTLWAEMQNTLAEVELSADSGSHVFGSDHAKALEDLRSAQLSLAQAWARSEADEVNVDEQEDRKVGRAAGLLGNVDPKEKHPETSGQEQRKNLEEETEKDILSARKRREENDRYFQRVNTGVLEVVAKLEDVARSMRAVEKESREIWSESESLDATSTSGG